MRDAPPPLPPEIEAIVEDLRRIIEDDADQSVLHKHDLDDMIDVFDTNEEVLKHGSPASQRFATVVRAILTIELLRRAELAGIK